MLKATGSGFCSAGFSSDSHNVITRSRCGGERRSVRVFVHAVGYLGLLTTGFWQCWRSPMLVRIGVLGCDAAFVHARKPAALLQ